jgi:hypothetical protein
MGNILVGSNYTEVLKLIKKNFRKKLYNILKKYNQTTNRIYYKCGEKEPNNL